MRTTLALLAFAGCASTASRYDIMVADLRREDRAAAASTATIDRFARAPVLDRDALIAAALAANRELEAMRQGWRAALAEVPAAGALDDPILTYEAAPLSIGSSSASFGQRVTLSQRLPFPGKRGLVRDAAVAEAEAMRGDVGALRLMIAEVASQLYDDAYLNARGFDLNEHHRKLVEQMRKAAELRVASGRASAQDVLEAEVELGHLEHDKAMLETERITIVARINGLLHRDPAAALPAAPSDLGVPAAPGDVSQLQRDAAQRRPQRAASEARVRASEAKVANAERAYYPDFEVMASYDSMWDMPEHRWMIGVGIELPLQRGKRAAEVEVAKAQVARARATAEQTIDEVRVEVTRAHRELVEALHVVHLYDERLLPVAKAQVDAAIAGFTTGKNDFPAVIQAQRGLREIQLAAYRARTDAWKARAMLDRAVGGVP